MAQLASTLEPARTPLETVRELMNLAADSSLSLDTLRRRADARDIRLAAGFEELPPEAQWALLVDALTPDWLRPRLTCELFSAIQYVARWAVRELEHRTTTRST